MAEQLFIHVSDPSLCSGHPALMAELIIGRYARANAVTALRTISSGNKTRLAALLVGFTGIVTVSFI